ncbi:MAG: hypothetical protein H6862_03245 [Rhodospirillales bacterium]|nr:hypothetical protein [Rhodospirillales bacterium]
MALNWEEINSGTPSAFAGPFGLYMALQNSWNDIQDRNRRYLESDMDLPTQTRRRLAIKALAHDRILDINPEIEFRIRDDSLGAPCFTPAGRTYRPIKRVDVFLHFNPTLPLYKNGPCRESLPLWNWFHILADEKENAKTLASALAAILPGTKIADPEWVVDLDRKLSIERSYLNFLPPYKNPLDYVENFEFSLKAEFELALDAAQEAQRLAKRPDLKNHLDFCGFFKTGLCPAFDRARAGGDQTPLPERRRAMMVQNAVMALVQNWPPQPLYSGLSTPPSSPVSP